MKRVEVLLVLILLSIVKLSSQGNYEYGEVDSFEIPIVLADCSRMHQIIDFVKTKKVKYNSRLIGGWTPLSQACACGELEFIQNLLHNGLDINTILPNDETLFTIAIQYGQLEIADELIKNGVNLNHRYSEGRSLLHKLINQENIPMIEYLLGLGFNPILIDSLLTTTTPLRHSLSIENFTLFEVLFRHAKSNYSYKEIYKLELHSSAAFFSRYKELSLILEYFKIEDIQKSNDRGRSILENAVYSAIMIEEGHFSQNKDTLSHFKTIDLILKSKIDINIINLKGQNVAFTSRSNPKVLKYLMTKGLKLEMIDKEGNVMLDYLVDDLIKYSSFIFSGMIVLLDDDNSNRNRVVWLNELLDMVNSTMANRIKNKVFIETIKYHKNHLLSYLFDIIGLEGISLEQLESVAVKYGNKEYLKMKATQRQHD